MLESKIQSNCFAGGVYPRTARFNHSCHPNCVFREGETKDKNGSASLEVRSVKWIEIGEEFTLSYRSWDHELGPDSLIWEMTPQRRAELHQDYGFECACSSCSSPSALEALPCTWDGCVGIAPLDDVGTCTCMACGKEVRAPSGVSGGDGMSTLMNELCSMRQKLRDGTGLPTSMRRSLLKKIPEVGAWLGAGHILIYRMRGLLVEVNQILMPDYPHPASLLAEMLTSVMAMDRVAKEHYPSSHPMRYPLLQLSKLILKHASLDDPMQKEALKKEAVTSPETLQQAQSALELDIDSMVSVHTSLFCIYCGRKARAAHDLPRCTRCRAVSYCNVSCQRSHWPQHKSHCHIGA